MKTIKESILGSTKSGKTFFMKDLAIKLAKQHKNVKYVEKKDDNIIRRDVYGQELKVGDLVFANGSFSTAPIEILLITEFTQSKNERIDGWEIMCYNPYTDKIEGKTVHTVVKIQNPEKYIV